MSHAVRRRVNAAMRLSSRAVVTEGRRLKVSENMYEQYKRSKQFKRDVRNYPDLAKQLVGK